MAASTKSPRRRVQRSEIRLSQLQFEPGCRSDQRHETAAARAIPGLYLATQPVRTLAEPGRPSAARCPGYGRIHSEKERCGRLGGGFASGSRKTQTERRQQGAEDLYPSFARTSAPRPVIPPRDLAWWYAP